MLWLSANARIGSFAPSSSDGSATAGWRTDRDQNTIAVSLRFLGPAESCAKLLEFRRPGQKSRSKEMMRLVAKTMLDRLHDLSINRLPSAPNSSMMASTTATTCASCVDLGFSVWPRRSSVSLDACAGPFFREALKRTS